MNSLEHNQKVIDEYISKLNAAKPNANSMDHQKQDSFTPAEPVIYPNKNLKDGLNATIAELSEAISSLNSNITRLNRNIQMLIESNKASSVEMF